MKRYRNVLATTLLAVVLALILGLSADTPDTDGDSAGGDGRLRADLLEDFNALRRAHGAVPVTSHPVLDRVAQERARTVAEKGVIESDVATLRRTSQALRAGGYESHVWIESSLIGSREEGALEDWREVNPRWVGNAAGGDFEHAGVGFAYHTPEDGGPPRPVFTLLLALTRRTHDLRLAEPLADLGEVRRILLDAVNAARRKNGRRPVKADPELDLAAQRHAEDMLKRSYYSHESPEGTTPAARARSAGYLGGSVGENIAKGLFDADETVRRWLDSPGHRQNVLRRNARLMGTGVAFGDNDNGFEVIWVQLFGS